jgi:hypothetical protein
MCFILWLVPHWTGYHTLLIGLALSKRFTISQATAPTSNWRLEVKPLMNADRTLILLTTLAVVSVH